MDELSQTHSKKVRSGVVRESVGEVLEKEDSRNQKFEKEESDSFLSVF